MSFQASDKQIPQASEQSRVGAGLATPAAARRHFCHLPPQYHPQGSSWVCSHEGTESGAVWACPRHCAVLQHPMSWLGTGQKGLSLPRSLFQGSKQQMEQWGNTDPNWRDQSVHPVFIVPICEQFLPVNHPLLNVFIYIVAQTQQNKFNDKQQLRIKLPTFLYLLFISRKTIVILIFFASKPPFIQKLIKEQMC